MSQAAAEAFQNGVVEKTGIEVANLRGVTQPEFNLTPASAQIVDVDTGEFISRKLGGFTILQRKSDGYVNATAMCKAAGRKINHWSENIDTKKVIGSISARTGIPVRDLVVMNMGGTPDIKGTWVHKKVALHLANWCSPEFYAAVLDWTVDEWDAGNTMGRSKIDFSDPIATARLFIEAGQASTRGEAVLYH